MVDRLLADAKPTEYNAFKVTLVERTLASILSESSGSEASRSKARASA